LNYLNPPGFLGTGASLLADVTLLAYVLLLVPGMLIGFYYARINKHRPQHRNIMIAITVINWILIFWLMIVAFSYDVGPNLGTQPGNARYLTPSVHAALGAVAQLLATYVVYRMIREDTQVAAAKKRGETDTSRYWFKSAKITMRIVLGLWLIVSVLGVLSYLIRYDVLKLGGSAVEVPIVVTEEPLATEEVAATDEVAVTDEAVGALGATLVITSGGVETTDEPSQLAVTEEVAALAVTDESAAPTDAPVVETEEAAALVATEEVAAPTEVALVVETEEPAAPTDAAVVETEEAAALVAETEAANAPTEVAAVATETPTDVAVAETEEPVAIVETEEPAAPTEAAAVATETPTDVAVAETEEPAPVTETQEVTVAPTTTSRSPSIIATVSALSVVVTPEVVPPVVAETQEVSVAATEEPAPATATPRPSPTRRPTATPRPSPTPAPTIAGEPLVEIGNHPRFGQILVDGEGRTLYAYANDEPGWSNCVGTCLTNWEIYEVEEDTPLVLGIGLDGELGLVERADGTYQVWYNEQPLYYFVLDRRPGDARGNGAANLWSVVEIP
jgi:predicted lipoprotein with Yx(FWY)xxD motif/uncharacterized membrane protein YozB (DUF420 family)